MCLCSHIFSVAIASAIPEYYFLCVKHQEDLNLSQTTTLNPFCCTAEALPLLAIPYWKITKYSSSKLEGWTKYGNPIRQPCTDGPEGPCNFWRETIYVTSLRAGLISDGHASNCGLPPTIISCVCLQTNQAGLWMKLSETELTKCDSLEPCGSVRVWETFWT